MSCVVPPRLLSRAEWTVTSLAGSEVTLPCEVTGDPWPVIRWSRDQLVIDMYSDDHKLLMRDSGSLVIPGVSVDDAARYQCVAENPAGVVSQDITLIVHGTYVNQPHPRLSSLSYRRSVRRCLYSGRIIGVGIYRHSTTASCRPDHVVGTRHCLQCLRRNPAVRLAASSSESLNS